MRLIKQVTILARLDDTSIEKIFTISIFTFPVGDLNNDLPVSLYSTTSEPDKELYMGMFATINEARAMIGKYHYSIIEEEIHEYA